VIEAPPAPTAADGRPQRPRIIFLVIGLVAAAALGVGLFTSLGTGPHGPPGVGSGAPTFSLPSLEGHGAVGTPADGGGGGRPAVLVFFASWCAPCRTEIPAIANAYRDQAGGHRVTVIGIDGMDPTGDARAFVRKSGVTFPVAADADYRVTEGLYYFDGDPDTVFINGNGTIARIVRGPVTASELVSWERELT
jgi:thiol-disulfide isomerase/thioredoxin